MTFERLFQSLSIGVVAQLRRASVVGQRQAAERRVGRLLQAMAGTAQEVQVAAFEGTPEPGFGFGMAARGAEHRGVAELAAKIAALGGTSIPVRSLRQVASDHQAFFVVAPHQVHRFRVALLGRLPIQRIGARLVLGHAAAGGVEIGQVVAGPVKAGLGGDPIVDGCRGWIRRAAPAMFKTASEHIARHCVAAFGGDREPGPRQGRVALDALAVQKDLSEQGLGFRQALARSAKDGLGNLARGTGQLCGETFGVQRVVTKQQVAHVQSSDQRRRRLW